MIEPPRTLRPIELAILAALGRHAAPMLPHAIANTVFGRDATGGEIADVRRALSSLGRRGSITLHRASIEGQTVELAWVPGPPPPPRAAADETSALVPIAAPRSEIDARPGSWAAAPLLPGTPTHVWTLHRNPAALDALPIAVRRRVIEGGDVLRFELARRPSGYVDRATLAARGVALAARARPALWIYDHRPTDEERGDWLRLRALAVAALATPPTSVWVVLPGPAGKPDRAVRCASRRAESRPGGGIAGVVDLEINMPVRGFRRKYAVDLVELAITGRATMRHKRSTITVSLTEPDAEALAGAERARRGRPDEAWFREDAAEFLGLVDTRRITAPEAALASFGLKIPCSVDDVSRAFRKRIITDRAHPDQGGDADEFRELTRLRNLAVLHVERCMRQARPA